MEKSISVQTVRVPLETLKAVQHRKVETGESFQKLALRLVEHFLDGATLQIDPELHRLIKGSCAQAGEKIEVFVDRAFRRELMAAGAAQIAIAPKGHRRDIKNG